MTNELCFIPYPYEPSCRPGARGRALRRRVCDAVRTAPDAARSVQPRADALAGGARLRRAGPVAPVLNQLALPQRRGARVRRACGLAVCGG